MKQQRKTRILISLSLIRNLENISLKWCNYTEGIKVGMAAENCGSLITARRKKRERPA
jgi:hypothetical protein